MTKPGRLTDGVRTVAFMTIVTFVCITTVSGLHLATRGRVAANESLFFQRAVMRVAGVEPAVAAAEVARWYDGHVRAVPTGGVPEYYEINVGEAERRVAFPAAGKGLWGAITAIVGLRADLRTIAGVVFLHHNETPGLGARISEPWFTAQLAGKTGPIRLVPEKTASADPREIDAVTGATITSAAVRDMLNRTLEQAQGRAAGAEEAHE